jgi:hypothetical protein
MIALGWATLYSMIIENESKKYEKNNKINSNK